MNEIEIYTCEKCGYQTPHSKTFDRHLKRKTPCKPKKNAMREETKEFMSLLIEFLEAVDHVLKENKQVPLEEMLERFFPMLANLEEAETKMKSQK